MARHKFSLLLMLAFVVAVVIVVGIRYARSYYNHCPIPVLDSSVPLPPQSRVVVPPLQIEDEHYEFTAPIESVTRADSSKPPSTVHLRFNEYAPSSAKTSTSAEPVCERWAVVATASVTSEAIRRQSRLVGWCLVMVVESDNICQEWRSARGGNEVVTCLSPKKLEEMKHPFANILPKSKSDVTRKNVGYLYAIQHGAQVVWDFDDHSLMKFWMPGAAPDSSLLIDAAIKGTTIDAAQPDGRLFITYNPYPAMSPSSGLLWPRGLPLRHIKKLQQYSTSVTTVKVEPKSIAVLQSLSDVSPDLDAICRLTAATPIVFKRTTEAKPVVLPVGTMSPYNSQATLHFQAGLWGLLLPTTVHSQVSDIWRSYIAQRLFWDVGLRTGFMPRPIVTREPETLDTMGDFVAEYALYVKSEGLIAFLQNWKSDAKTLVERVEQLWVALYNEGYIEELDVEILQLWLQSLLDIGYKFPEIGPDQFKPRHDVKRSDTKMVNNDGSCKVTKPLTFWTSDLHDGTRIDMTSALSSMGHKVLVAGHKGYNSPYPYVFNMPGVSVYTRLSGPIAGQLHTHTTPLDENTIKVNFEFYKGDETIFTTDAFFCSFPASMCELWMPFNKSIVYLPAHRYNLGRCSKARWDRLNEHLHLLASMDKPKHVIAAESVYDLEYLRHYTGITPLPLYSYSGFYTQLPGNEYSPKRDEILVFNHWEDGIAHSTSKFVLKEIRQVYPRYSLANLASHRAIVFFPYSVMSYKFTELYSLSIPLFVPSMLMMRARRFVSLDRTSVSPYYCNLPGLDGEMAAHPTSPHPYSPNVEANVDAEAEAYWMQLSDFYVLPHITHFDDYADLGRKLEGADFNSIHSSMLEENKYRKQQLIENWCWASNRIQSGRKVPQDYQKAISELYGVNELQAP